MQSMDKHDSSAGKVSQTRDSNYSAEPPYRHNEEADKSALGPKLKNFSDLPIDIQREIITNLGDEDLWVLRDLNHMFYESFFEQTVIPAKHFYSTLYDEDRLMSRKFNSYRAIQLAKMGRVFKNVEYLVIFHRGTVSTLDNRNFPKLKFLDVLQTHFSFTSIIHSVRKLRWDTWWEPDIWEYHEVFPNLEELIIGDFNSNDIGKFPKLRAVDTIASDFHWMDIFTVENFPLLSKLTIHRENLRYYLDIWHGDRGDFDAAVLKLRSQGVTVVILG